MAIPAMEPAGLPAGSSNITFQPNRDPARGLACSMKNLATLLEVQQAASNPTKA
jgi:hypothetical protein